MAREREFDIRIRRALVLVEIAGRRHADQPDRIKLPGRIAFHARLELGQGRRAGKYIGDGAVRLLLGGLATRQGRDTGNSKRQEAGESVHLVSKS